MPTSVMFGDGTNTQPVIGYTVDFSFTCGNGGGTFPLSAVTTFGGNNLSMAKSARWYAELQGNIGDVLDIAIECSPDGGTTWVEIYRFPQLAAGAAKIVYTFSVSRNSESGGILVTGNSGSSIVLAANTVSGGDWADRLRVKYKNGASTTTGKAQVIKAFFCP